MASARPRRRYRPAKLGRFTWWWARVLTRPAIRSAAVARDRLGRSRRQIADDAIEASIGSAPDRRQRANLLEIMATGGIVLAFIAIAMGVGVGLGVGAVSDDATGSIVMRAFGVLFSAPLIALSMVFAIRWFFDSRDLRSAAPDSLPDQRSQPSDRDLVFAVPLAILLALFFVLV